MTERICSCCGSDERLEKHHVKYNPPIIQILCKECHTELHIIKQEKQKNIPEWVFTGKYKRHSRYDYDPRWIK